MIYLSIYYITKYTTYYLHVKMFKIIPTVIIVINSLKMKILYFSNNIIVKVI